MTAAGKDLASRGRGGIIGPGFPVREASLAQLVEQLTCNEQVFGSNPKAGSNLPFPA